MVKRYDRLSEWGSEAATNEAGNKVITFDGLTHVTWQDYVEEGYYNRVRTLDRGTGKWSETYTLDKARDNHARGVITADSRGFLHVILSGHNTPCNYRCSIRPNDASEWTEPVEVASGTYPYLLCGPEDTLYLTLRNADRCDGVDFYSKESDGEWRFRCKVVAHDHKYTGYAAFAGGMCFDASGVLHLVSDFFEGFGSWEDRGVHQAVAYMHSADGGSTWRTWQHDPIEPPARPHDMDVIAQSTGTRHEDTAPPIMVAQGNIAVDSDGRPHVFYLYHLNEPGQLLLASPNDEGVWREHAVDPCKTIYPAYRPMACRGAFTIGEDGVFRALVSLAPVDDPGWVNGLPVRNPGFARESGAPVVWLVSEDGGKNFSIEPLVEPDEHLRINTPKFELAVGAGIRPAGAPDVLTFDSKRHRLPGIKDIQGIQNNVFWFPGDAYSRVHRGVGE